MEKIFSRYPLVMSHLIDVEPLCLRKETGEHVWKRCHNRRIAVYPKE
jgi:hypothetical protein